MKFLTNRPFWLNLLVAIAIVTLIIVLFFGFLDRLTKHNKYIKVPSVLGKNVDSAIDFLEANGFDVEVQDSVYIDSLARLSVTRQSPEADFEVKEGRTVYLTINRAIPPLIDMPDLRGFSYKSAELYLKSLSFKMGDTSYKPDIAKNFVLDQLMNGSPIKPGTKINMGSKIDFVLGSGVGATAIDVPDLFGLTLAEAKTVLDELKINMGAIAAASDVTDQNAAFIYEQSPAPSVEPIPGQLVKNKIRPGQYIDVKIQTSKPTRPEPAAPVDSVSQNPPSIGQ